jgi:hypothetical protein
MTGMRCSPADPISSRRSRADATSSVPVACPVNAAPVLTAVNAWVTVWPGVAGPAVQVAGSTVTVSSLAVSS